MRQFQKIIIGLLAMTASPPLGAAEQAIPASPAAAEEFLAAGKNRAVIQMDRQIFAGRLEINDWVTTAAKKSGGLKFPEEAQYLYQVVDPVPLQSYKVYTPWLNHFKESMVFVIGRLDPDRIKIARWSVSLYDANGKQAKSFAGLGQPPAAFYWNGRDSEQNPVAVGKTFVPEIILEDFYGAKVMLPQKSFVLDQFVWAASRQMRVGVLQASVFADKQISFSGSGQAIMQELSFLISQQDAVFIEIDCSDPDPNLAQERAAVLKKYFAKENLKLKKIQINNSAKSAESVFYITAAKLYNRGN